MPEFSPPSLPQRFLGDFTDRQTKVVKQRIPTCETGFKLALWKLSHPLMPTFPGADTGFSKIGGGGGGGRPVDPPLDN